MRKKLVVLGMIATMSVAGTMPTWAEVEETIPELVVEVDNSDTEPVLEELAASEEVNIAVESEDTNSLSEDTQAAELEIEQQKTETEQQKTETEQQKTETERQIDDVKEVLRKKVSAGIITPDKIETTVEKLLSELDEQEKKDFIAELNLLVPQTLLEEEMQGVDDNMQDVVEETNKENDTSISSIKSQIREKVSKGWIWRSEIDWYIEKLLPSLTEQEKAEFAEELHNLYPMDYELIAGLKARIREDVSDGMVEEYEIEELVNMAFDGGAYLDEDDKAAFIDEVMTLMPEELNPKRLKTVVLPYLRY